MKKKAKIHLLKPPNTTAMASTVVTALEDATKRVRSKKDGIWTKALIIFADDHGVCGFECANMTDEERVFYMEKIKFHTIRGH